MKWNIISHNIRGLNDPDNIAKKRSYINFLTPRIDVLMIQEHKLRGRALEHIEVNAGMRKLDIGSGPG